MIASNPLVSIVVLTYNSASYIIETLESIKDQDYPNMELVVSDDGSKDGTYSIVIEWIEQNKNRFVRSIIIRSFENQGTSFNYNHGIINSTGSYIKTLDGDDCLNGQRAISAYVDFVENNNVDICISDVELFTKDNMDITKFRSDYDFYFSCVCEDYMHQKSRIVTELALPNPAVFFSRKLYMQIGGYDIRYKYLEEWPFFYKAIMSGFQIYPIKERLVKYRLISKSVSHNTVSKVYVELQRDLFRFYRDHLIGHLFDDRRYVTALKLYRRYFNKVFISTRDYYTSRMCR